MVPSINFRLNWIKTVFPGMRSENFIFLVFVTNTECKIIEFGVGVLKCPKNDCQINLLCVGYDLFIGSPLNYVNTLV